MTNDKGFGRGIFRVSLQSILWIIIKLEVFRQYN